MAKRELEIEQAGDHWRLTISAADIYGRIETSSLVGLSHILAAYGRFREQEPKPNDDSK